VTFDPNDKAFQLYFDALGKGAYRNPAPDTARTSNLQIV